MLHAPQLSALSQRYSPDIAEIRAFLRAAKLPLDDSGSLDALAAAIHEDRAIRRDLTSYLWLVVDRQDEITAAALLGILALAAAGAEYAADADDATAHRLLRFVLEARRSIDREQKAGAADAASANSAPMLPPTETHLLADSARHGRGQALAAPLQVRSASRETRWGGASVRRAAGRAAAIASVLFAAGLFWWRIAERPTFPAGGVASLVTHDGSAVGPSTANVSTPLPAVDSPLPEKARVRKSSPADRARTASVAESRTSRVTAEAMPTPAALASGGAATTAANTPAPIVRSGTPAPNPRIVPEAVLSSRLAVPVDTAAYDPLYAVDPRHPYLHRRPAKPGETQLAAEEAPESPADLALADAVHVPVVRQTAVGAMASNLIYSPATAYPREASARHVQGQVKVQADIGRDGSVASARVISGPPLLRDAALESVLRWRYRPMTVGKKTVPADSMAVLDFELP